MDDYKTIYLKELLALIDKVAISCMMCPIHGQIVGEGENRNDPTFIDRYNSDAAWNNEGVCEMARRLKEELAKDD